MEDTIMIAIMVIIMVAVVKFLVHISERKQTSTFTDPRDGRTYKTVKIGRQTWMAENLNYDAPGSKYYDNNIDNGQKYGRLYNWETAKKACPPGWHLPSKDEWRELVKFAGCDAKLKAVNGWFKNGNGTDEYGFRALPGGLGYHDGDFDRVGKDGHWWSSTEDSDSNAWGRCTIYGPLDTFGSLNHKEFYFSVRCIKD